MSRFNPGRHAGEARGRITTSVVAWDRTVVGRHAIGEIEQHLIDIAPPPSFGRIVTFDDRMSGRVVVLGGVPAGRLIAAADMSACATDPEGTRFAPSSDILRTPTRSGSH